MRRIVSLLFMSAFSVGFAPRSAAQVLSDSVFIRDNYGKFEYRIPMRDGVRLFTSVYIPKDTTAKHPIILTRTPYSVAPYGPEKYIQIPGPFRSRYFHEKYIVVNQDVRGRYMSEGKFKDVRPYLAAQKGPKDIDETTDSFDTVDWLIENVPHNNGRVGVSGISYPGFYSSMAAIDAHPAVKAVSPQAPVSAWMRGDDFSHNGAFLLPHAFNFYIGFGWPRREPTESDSRPFFHGTPDDYQFFLDIGPVKNLNRRFMKDSVEFWNAMTSHWKWDEFWEARDVLPRLRNMKPAMLFVGGWFDTENLWGALNAYAETEQHNPHTSNQLVIGPWSHGQWGVDEGNALGSVSWGIPSASIYRDSVEFPFFRYHLEGKGEPRKFEAAMFLTGKNEWRYLDCWPPKGCDSVKMFVCEEGKLAAEPPKGGSAAFDEYVNDPSKPVPYTDEITRWYNPAFMLGDQRFASRRPDVVTYQSDTLTQDVILAGPVEVRLFVSTTGTDCDWIVKVIDVFPDYTPDPSPNPRQVKLGGYQMLVRGDVMRGKFRESMTDPQPFVPGKITAVNFRMQDLFHDFGKGHRIMVQIQSSWFPMIDRNPGKFLNIFTADESDFQKTTQRIYHSAAYPSCVAVHQLR